MPTHRLAAILFTDIVGYTAMMREPNKEIGLLVPFHLLAKMCIFDG